MSELVNILEQVLREKSVISSHSLNAMLKLAFTLVSTAIKRDLSVLIVDERGYFERYAPLELIDRAVITNNFEDVCGNTSALVIVFAPKSLRGLPRCKALNIVIFTSYFGARVLNGYVKYYLKRIPGTNEYALLCYEKNISARIELGLSCVKAISLPGIYGKAYEALKNALLTYGEMKVKDAILVISKELGVDKKRARLIVTTLARRGYFRVVKGKMALT